ncbi:MAG TPA: hypothetical protein VF329_05405 [Gammaproteobacteria bacterium]
MARTRKTQELLALIHRGAGEDGIYALAAAAGRPYRRVHDQVKRLAAEGLVRLERASVGPRTALRVRPLPPREPKLSFNRAWSRPRGGVDEETVIAQVLARPTFNDLLACVEHYGLERVQRARAAMLRAFELSPGAAEASGRMLKNIEIGRARAAGRH